MTPAGGVLAATKRTRDDRGAEIRRVGMEPRIEADGQSSERLERPLLHVPIEDDDLRALRVVGFHLLPLERRGRHDLALHLPLVRTVGDNGLHFAVHRDEDLARPFAGALAEMDLASGHRPSRSRCRAAWQQAGHAWQQLRVDRHVALHTIRSAGECDSARFEDGWQHVSQCADAAQRLP